MLRLDAYKRLNAIVRDWSQFDEKVALLLIYNCIYFISNVEDLALKESSTNTLLELMRKSVTLELKSLDKYIFESQLLTEIKSGLKNKNENARHEFVALLHQFIRIFEHVFPKYLDLLKLNDTDDVERDFFENIRHIQV
jgi:hypothetical protein